MKKQINEQRSITLTISSPRTNSFFEPPVCRGSLWLFKLLKTNIRFTPHFFSSHSPSIHKIKTSLNSFPQMDTNSRCPIHPSIEITDDDLAVDIQRNALSLLGIFLGNLPPYPLVISNLKKKEQLEGSISITGLEFGLCQFIFSSENDKLKVLKKSPILTNKYFICLSDWEPPTPQAVALLVHAPFWIHLCDLPRKYCTVKIGEKLGSLIGQVVLSTICEDIASHRLFLRIRVILNAARPLISEVGAVHNSFHIQTTVRYENIPLLCFTCGLLGHDKKHCPRRLFPSTSTSKFGPELRARRGWRQVDEISLRPLPHQPPESFWEPLNSRMNHFEIPAEEANPISAFLNDPVIMHEPFFQQSHPMSIKQELQITSVEAVTFFQNTGMSSISIFSILNLYKQYAFPPSLISMACFVKPCLYEDSVAIITKVKYLPNWIPNRKNRPSSLHKLIRMLNYPCALMWWLNLGPPTVHPQSFDMNPRPQGIVIREPIEEEDYLEQSSPDTVLFKTPEIVLLELGDQKTSTDEITAEQCAIEICWHKS
ncbi:hypothetical protein LINGRAHAP2_LOCUS7346 [Linum grandiflorum]